MRAIFERNIKTIMTGLQALVALEGTRDEKTAEKIQGDPDVLLQLLRDLELYVKREQACPLQ